MHYYMSRYSTQLMPTFEAVIGVLVLLWTIDLYHRSIDRNALRIFLVITVLHYAREFTAQWIGVRVIENAHVFGIPVHFTITAMIIAIFEGGVLGLAAYQLVPAAVNRDRRAWKVFTRSCIVLGLLSLAGAMVIRGQLGIHPERLQLTRRAIYAPESVVALAVSFLIAVGYSLSLKSPPPGKRTGFLVYYAGLVIVLAVLIIPMHCLQVRFIETNSDGGFVAAGPLAQIVVMYVYNILLEAGWFVPDYVVLCLLGWVEFRGGAEPAACPSLQAVETPADT
jgi:hypothetical protein